MSLKAKELEKVYAKPPKIPRFSGGFIAVLRLFMHIRPIRKWLSNTVGGLNGAIFECFKSNDYEKAAKIAVYALKRYRYKSSRLFPFAPHFHWWGFMKLAAQSLDRCESKDMRNDVIRMAREGIEPFGGYDVAYSFDRFSRWKFSDEDFEAAIELAKIASQADETWPEPDFLLGWYAFVLCRDDPIPHLRRAIEKDGRILFRLSKDPLYQQNPDVLRRLLELAIEHGVVVPEKGPVSSD